MGEPRTLQAVKDAPYSERARGWIFGGLLLATSLVAPIFIIFPAIPLLFYSHKHWRWINDRLVGSWMAMPGVLLELLWGTRVRVVGHKIDRDEPALMIMNHRTRLDWLFFWSALYKMDPWLLISEKISLKAMLKLIPGAGWAMEGNAFLFLDRSLLTDALKLEKILDYYADSGKNYQLLLFPEGTDKCPIETAKSEKFAKEKGLTHYEYVLHARTTGFVQIIKKMRARGYIKSLYDVTIGFGDSIVQSEVELVTHGICPKEIHYQVEKIGIDSLPEKDEELVEWLQAHWAKKEEKLKLFYARQNTKETFPLPVRGQEFISTPSMNFALYLNTFIWMLFMIYSYYLICTVN